MSRLSAVVVMIGLGAFSFVTSGCAGELTDAQKETREGGLGTGGSGGSGGSGGTGGSGVGGSGGSGGSTGGGAGNPEACVLAMAKDKSCGIVGCHGGTNAAAGLLLTEDALRQAKDNFLDKPNKGNGGVMPGCNAGVQKLIDKAQPEKSLLYTKLTPQFPCGLRMPSGGSVSDAELSCVLAWIKSVAGVP
jgi:hypothetical protein